MKVLDRIYDVVFREFPHRAKTGLFEIGSPGPRAPVIVTGNYTETVRRMRRTLAGLDAWLLVANSKGINVWCAAGGGHFTHHDVISAILTSGILQKVEDRLIILPQLSATGIEGKRITEATGWEAVWGPAMLQDLPSFLAQKHSATPKQRFVRFPILDRMEMATMWGIPMIVIGILIFSLIGGIVQGLSVGIAAAVISFGLFSALPWVNIKGPSRWIIFSAFALAGILASWSFLFVERDLTTKSIAISAVGSVIEMLALSVDLAGTTPWYGSYINTFRNHAHIDLIEEKCNGSADCLQVCPIDVFRMDGSRKKIGIVSGENCIECGACIVQCPQDALRFRYDDGRVAEAFTIRNTRMNMLGRRITPPHEKL